MQSCEVLGEVGLAREAKELRDQIRQAYIAKYADLDIPSQTLYAMELAFDFCDDREATFQKLVQNVETADCQIRGGVFAAKYVLDVLTENGRFDLAYKMATQPNYPGWVYMTNVNAGTLGEDWGGGKSGNHHLMSHIGAWFYKALAGIQIDEAAPGFASVKLQPHIPADMDNFCAWHDSPNGRVSVSWDAEYLYVDTPVPAQFVWQGCTTILQPGSYRYNREG
jgi:alpha-L-rhamnosidase